MMFFFVVFLYGCGDHRDLHVLTHSVPTRRSSDLKLPDEIVDTRQPCRVLDFGRRGIRLAVGDVVVDRIVEQNRVLRDDADRLAQALLRYRADILSVDADGACVDVDESTEERRGGKECVGTVNTRWAQIH